MIAASGFCKMASTGSRTCAAKAEKIFAKNALGILGDFT
jgi:hypothetical protein